MAIYFGGIVQAFISASIVLLCQIATIYFSDIFQASVSASIVRPCQIKAIYFGAISSITFGCIFQASFSSCLIVSSHLSITLLVFFRASVLSCIKFFEQGV